MKTTTKIIGLIVLGAAGAGFFFWRDQNKEVVVPTTENENTTGATTTSSNTPTNTGTVVNASKYKDGVYTTTAKYNTPAGLESLGVTISLADDKITTAEVVNKGADKTSKSMQDRFIGGYTSKVVGQDIDGLKLGVTSGASLTTGGFNSALATIRAQALN
jgi:uncharacterized protein with FMN-binding domain